MSSSPVRGIENDDTPESRWFLALSCDCELVVISPRGSRCGFGEGVGTVWDEVVAGDEPSGSNSRALFRSRSDFNCKSLGRLQPRIPVCRPVASLWIALDL